MSTAPRILGMDANIFEEVTVCRNAISLATCKYLANCGDLRQNAGLLTPHGSCSYTGNLESVFDMMGRHAQDAVRRLCDLIPMYDSSGLEVDHSVYARLETGGGHVMHADACKLDGTPNHTPRRKIAMLVYLRTCGEDFVGGHLRFPEQDIVIRPSAGLMVTSPCTLEFRHDVTLVRAGVRDNIAVWFR